MYQGIHITVRIMICHHLMTLCNFWCEISCFYSLLFTKSKKLSNFSFIISVLALQKLVINPQSKLVSNDIRSSY